MAEETWRILISEDSASGGGGIGDDGGSSSTDDSNVPPLQKQFYQQAAANFNLWKPFISIGGMLYAMYQSSNLTKETFKSVYTILQAMMDLILLPLMPLVLKMLDAMAPLVQKVGDLADAFLTPIVEVLEPILDDILGWVEGIDFAALETTFREKGEAIANVIGNVYDWLTTTAIPKVTEWADEIKAIWEGEGTFVEKLLKSWSVIWEDIQPYAEEAWKWIRDKWDEYVTPEVLKVWETIEGLATTFWEDTIVAGANTFMEDLFGPEGTIATFWDQLVTNAETAISSLFSEDGAITLGAISLWETIEELATTFWEDTLSNSAESLFGEEGMISGWAEDTWKDISTWAEDTWDTINEDATALWKQIDEDVTALWKQIGIDANAFIATNFGSDSVVQKSLLEIWKTIDEDATALWTTMSTDTNALFGPEGSISGWSEKTWSDIETWADGIFGEDGSILKWADEYWKSITKWAKNFFQFDFLNYGLYFLSVVSHNFDTQMTWFVTEYLPWLWGTFIHSDLGNMFKVMIVAILASQNLVIGAIAAVALAIEQILNKNNYGEAPSPPNWDTSPYNFEEFMSWGDDPHVTAQKQAFKHSPSGGGYAGWQIETEDELHRGGFIPETGLYKLHRGEEVITAGKVGLGSGRAIEIQNIFNIDLATDGDVDSLVREIERKVTDSLTSILRRA